VASDIENEGAGADKLKAFASVLNTYNRMLQAERKPKAEGGGDPYHHGRLLNVEKADSDKKSRYRNVTK